MRVPSRAPIRCTACATQPAKGLTAAQRKAAIAARPAEDPVSAGLSRCLDAASERRSHVPLRDSKLTRFFKPMLVGSARAIVVLAADLSEFEETDAACVGAHRYAKLVAKVRRRRGARPLRRRHRACGALVLTRRRARTLTLIIHDWCWLLAWL